MRLAIDRAERRAYHAIADPRYHRAHLVASDNARADISALVMHAGEHRRALLQFRIRQAERETATLAQSHIDTGCSDESTGKFRPKFGGGAGPVRIGRHSRALALHPYQSEIAAHR